jgi:hypothetical protein
MAGLTERNQTLKREDLSDILTEVDQKACPFISMAKTGSAPKNSLVEWGLDAYPAVRTTPVVDDADVSAYEDMSNREKAQNYVQIFQRAPKVSRLANLTSDVAGVGFKQEMARSIAKALVMVKRDMEATFLGNNDAQADNGVVGYGSKSANILISTTGGSTLQIPSGFRTPAGSINSNSTQVNLTEEEVRSILKSIWDQTGENNKSFTGICGSSVKNTLSQMSLYRPAAADGGTKTVYIQSNRDAADATLTSGVDVIDTDFGKITLHLDSFIRSDSTTAGPLTMYLFNMDNIEIKYASQPSFRELPDLGGGPRGLVEAVATLCSYSGGLDHGKIVLTA